MYCMPVNGKERTVKHRKNKKRYYMRQKIQMDREKSIWEKEKFGRRGSEKEGKKIQPWKKVQTRNFSSFGSCHTYFSSGQK